MKRMVIVLFYFISLTTSVCAKGLYQEGFVDISTLADGSTQLIGSFNNRYNTIEYGTPTQLIALANPGNGPVVFYAVDSNNTTFMCFVSFGTPNYDYAYDAAMNLRSGSMLHITRAADSNECSYVALTNASVLLD